MMHQAQTSVGVTAYEPRGAATITSFHRSLAERRLRLFTSVLVMCGVCEGGS